MSNQKKKGKKLRVSSLARALDCEKVTTSSFNNFPVTILKCSKKEWTSFFSEKVRREIFLTARTKGKGFTGVVAKGSSRGPMSHGSGHHRTMGSTGSIAGNRVFKGTRMPGRTGFSRRTVKSKIINDFSCSEESRCLIARGTVPGSKKRKVLL